MLEAEGEGLLGNTYFKGKKELWGNENWEEMANYPLTL